MSETAGYKVAEKLPLAAGYSLVRVEGNPIFYLYWNDELVTAHDTSNIAIVDNGNHDLVREFAAAINHASDETCG